MFYGARCCKAVLDNDTMNYIMFGKGTKPLVILPGLGDGLSPVHGQLQAVIFAINYKKFAEQFKVYIFSRKNSLTENYSTRDMAEDQAEAMKTLGLSKAYVMGVSQGGMIAQYLAMDHPELESLCWQSLFRDQMKPCGKRSMAGRRWRKRVSIRI
jgi:pimeloyl-ACP methyl ester carboxylesterase